jgi:hypothetical protein
MNSMKRSGAKGSGTLPTLAQAGRAEIFIYQSVFSMLDTGIFVHQRDSFAGSNHFIALIPGGVLEHHNPIERTGLALPLFKYRGLYR